MLIMNFVDSHYSIYYVYILEKKDTEEIKWEKYESINHSSHLLSNVMKANKVVF